MINLYRYLNDIFENNAVKTTLIQELLSCVFFDAWFNMDNKFDKTEDIYEYYKRNLTLIQNICAMSNSKLKIKDFDDFMNPTKKSKDWQKSFIFQCKSFENWIKNHPSFKPGELTFVHHDTHIGIFKSSVSTGWQIAERVNKGVKKFGYPKKDLYQKADIYAVVNKIDNTPEKDIESEVVYWINALSNNSKDKFVGISLKKLSKSISNVYTFGLDNSVEAIEDGTVTFKIDTFNINTFNPAAGDIVPGIITTYIHFNVNESYGENSDFIERSEYDIFVKSNGKGVEHATKDPLASYIAPVTTELKKKNSSAQSGKAQSLINDWLEENNDIDKDVLKSNNCKGKGPEDFLSIHKYICSVLDNLNNEKISSYSFNFTPQAIQLLNFLSNNYIKIDEVYKTFKDKNGDEKSVLSKIKEISVLKEIDKTKSFKEIMVMLYNITKWYNVSWKILNVYYIIAKQIEKNGLNKTILDIYNYSKGISSKDKDLNLPYVLIGQ